MEVKTSDDENCTMIGKMMEMMKKIAKELKTVQMRKGEMKVMNEKCEDNCVHLLTMNVREEDLLTLREDTKKKNVRIEQETENADILIHQGGCWKVLRVESECTPRVMLLC